MLRLVPRWLCVFAFAVSAFSSAANAKPFDLIYADRVDVTNTAFTSGFSYGNDIGLIVNTGTSDITASDLSGVTFTASSSNPAVLAQVSLDNVGSAAPILPQEAVGTLLPGSVLPALVLPGETLRNTFPAGILWLGTSYPAGFSGTVVVDVTMTIGADVAHYLLTLNLTTGPEYAISVSHAGRVSSTAVTATRTGSWGAIKKLYR